MLTEKLASHRRKIAYHGRHAHPHANFSPSVAIAANALGSLYALARTLVPALAGSP